MTSSTSSHARLLAYVLIAAGATAMAFVALHGQVAPDSDPQAFIDNFVTHIAAQESWGASQTLRIAAYLLWLMGLVGLMRLTVDENARRTAAFATPVLVLGTGMWMLHIAAEYGTAWLMTGHEDAPLVGYLEMAKGLRLIDVGILTVAGLTYSLGLLGVGRCLLSSEHPSWFGWSLIAISGPPAALSVVLGITSNFDLITPIVLFSVALAMWSIVVGVAMLVRRAGNDGHVADTAANVS